MSHDTIARKRQTDRDSLFLSAELVVEGAPKPVSVRVRNLSPGGMMVDGHKMLRDGVGIETELRSIGPVTGRVAWTTADRAGIAFDEDVDPKLARYPVATPAQRITYGKRFDESRRPGLKVRD